MAEHDSGPYIFISYSHRDKERVDSIAQEMESRGYTVWYDRDIQSGGTWTKALADRIAACNVFLPFISAEFGKSFQCMREVYHADEAQRVIVPVLMDREPLPEELKFLLGKLQRHRLEPEETPEQVAAWLDSQDAFRDCRTAPTAHGKARARCVTLDRPSRPSAAFVGREQKMQDLEAALRTGHAALCGMGGIGKSEICRKLFREYTAGAGTDLAKAVGWVMWRSSPKDTVYGQFPAIEETNAEEYWRKTRDWLSAQGPDLLLFVDNADDITAEQAAELSKLPCRLLLTSRQNAVDGFTSIDTENLSPDECRRLYRLTYAGEAKTDGAALDGPALDAALPDAVLDEILRLSAYHTLTVELLAKTQWTAELSAEEVRDRLNASGFDLSDVMEKIRHLRRTGEINGVEEYLPFLEHLCRVFDLSKLRDTGDEGKAGPLYALRGLSLLAPNTPAPVKDVMKWLDIPSRDGLTRAARAGWLKKGFEKGAQTVSIHPVVSAVVRKTYPPEAVAVHALAGRLLSAMIPGETEVFTEKLPVLKHALALDRIAAPLHLSENYGQLFGLVPGQMLMQMGYLLYEQGEYENALSCDLKGVGLLEKVFRPEHPKLATSYNNIGSVYSAQGDYPRALEYHQKALRIWEKVLGPEHPHTATSYNNIGTVYDEQGDYPHALEYYQKALRIREKVLGPEHPNIAISYGCIGNVYLAQGDYLRALEYYQKVLRVDERVLVIDHPDTAFVYINFGQAYRMQGDYPRAQEYLQKALRIREQVLGPEHPETASSYHNIGTLYFEQGEYTEALKWLEKALTVRLNVLGPNHPDTILTQVWLDATRGILSVLEP